jgi:hypothetical protein
MSVTVCFAYALQHATRELSQKKLGNAIGWTLFINIGAQEELGKAFKMTLR